MDNKHYHFIGIGGIGVGALAALSLDKGYRVSGSDLRTNQVTERLRSRGAQIFLGHAAENIGNADGVIFTSAVAKDNPELAEAQKKQIPVMQRAKFLAELMQGYTAITVAGAHGKTTTTSMAAHLLEKAGLKPTTAIGGIVNETHAHAQLGGGPYFVAEVDESDGSFLHFHPYYSVITNIDFEHVDYYHNWQSVLDVYRQFIRQTQEEGTLFAYGDDDALSGLLRKSGRAFKTYGFSQINDVRAVDVQLGGFSSTFRCLVDGKDFGVFSLKVPGKVNIANALACVSLGLKLSLDPDAIRESLKSFTGVQRRFQLKQKIDDIWVVDDYGHHPTEIKATLETAQRLKSVNEQIKRLVTVFQPHRYSRVKGLFDDFARSLSLSDYLIITDIYAASEQPIEGVSAQGLCERIRSMTNNPVTYISKEKIVDHLLAMVQPQDLVLTLGAGDITRIGEELVEALKKRSQAAEVGS